MIVGESALVYEPELYDFEFSTDTCVRKGQIKETLYIFDFKAKNLDKNIFDIDILVDEDSKYIPETLKSLVNNIYIVPPYQKLKSYNKKNVLLVTDNTLHNLKMDEKIYTFSR